MTYEFTEALQRALNVLREEKKIALDEYEKDPKNEIKKACYMLYAHIIDRLDSLI